MRKVHDDIVKAFPGHILNIHPSLLPAYGGKGMWGHHVHEAVIAAGEKVSGATVHLVTEHIDGGDIILQGHVEVTPDDTPDTLEQKVHKIEYDIYPKAILTLINKQV
jgi:phosphoribosylglycinamide formyltransferase-1